MKVQPIVDKLKTEPVLLIGTALALGAKIYTKRTGSGRGVLAAVAPIIASAAARQLVTPVVKIKPLVDDAVASVYREIDPTPYGAHALDWYDDRDDDVVDGPGAPA